MYLSDLTALINRRMTCRSFQAPYYNQVTITRHGTEPSQILVGWELLSPISEKFRFCRLCEDASYEPSNRETPMAALNPPACNFDWPAPDFDLPGIDGKRYNMETARGTKGLLVMFICNHCPYVRAIIDRLIRDCRDLTKEGIGSIAIMSNDAIAYPEDSFVNMKLWAQNLNFSFPYVYDESQAVARSYNAVCTPDFFGFNAELKLQYRGRLDASGRNTAPANIRRELFEAMRQVAQTGQGPSEQNASIGCSIKWRR